MRPKANTILICARGKELRTELEEALADAGHKVTSVTTPADAVATMRKDPIDLIVAEGLAASGAIASLRVASEGRITPILVVAPAHDVEARIAFLEAGADDVISGGFEPTELTGRVTALLIRTGRIATDLGAHPGTGEIVAFFSPKGGVGTTTLAVNTAVLLAGGAGTKARASRADERGPPLVPCPADRSRPPVRAGRHPPEPHAALRRRRTRQ